MKTLKDIIIEKLIINKDSKLKNNNQLDVVFKNADEFQKTLTSYFGDKIKRKIDIYPEESYFSDTMSVRTSGQMVCGYGYIDFKDDTFIKCGLVKNNKRLLMQVGQYDNNNIKLYDEKLTEFDDGYNFKEDNFKEWLEKYQRLYPKLVNKFKLNNNA